MDSLFTPTSRLVQTDSLIVYEAEIAELVPAKTVIGR